MPSKRCIVDAPYPLTALILEHKHGMNGLDATIANCEKVMQQMRGDFAAIVKARDEAGNQC